MNNYQLNKQTMTLQELSDFLGLPVLYTMRYMNKVLVKLANFFDLGGENQDWARAQFCRTIFLGFENQAISRSQVDLLLRSQGAEYKAFISRDVNQSIANLNQTQRANIELLKVISDALRPNQGTTNNILFNLPNNAKNTNYITADRAIQMIRENTKSMLDNPAESSHFLEGQELPNIDARTQDLSAIGVKTIAHPQEFKKAKKLKNTK